MARFGPTDPITKDVKYSDINITFAAHPVTKKLSVLKNNDAIKRALKNLIFTNQFEVPYQPVYGGNIRSYLFNLLDEQREYGVDSAAVKSQIQTAIRNYEPRVTVNDIFIESDFESLTLNVTIDFSVLNQPEPDRLQIFLERSR